MLFLSILLAKLNKLLTELDWTAFLLFCFWFPFLFVRLLFSWNNFILCSNRILYPIFHCAPTTTIILSLYLNLIEEFPIIFSSRNKNRLHSFFSTFFTWLFWEITVASPVFLCWMSYAYNMCIMDYGHMAVVVWGCLWNSYEAKKSGNPVTSLFGNIQEHAIQIHAGNHNLFSSSFRTRVHTCIQLQPDYWHDDDDDHGKKCSRFLEAKIEKSTILLKR